MPCLTCCAQRRKRERSKKMDRHENGGLGSSHGDEEDDGNDDKSSLNEEEYDNISFSDLSDMSDEEEGDGKISDGEIRATAVVELETTDGKSGVSYGIVSEESHGNKKCFIPDTPVDIKIVGATYQPKSHRLNPYLYTIEIKHGIYQWTIEKRFNRFQVLHAHLDMARATIVFHDRSLEHAIKVPKLPKRPEVVVKEEKKPKRMERLEKFLQEVVAIDTYRENKHTHNFLGTSHLSFAKGYGGKEKESEVFKRVGGHNFTKGYFGVSRFDPTWHKRWLVVKQNFVTYLNKDTGELRDVMLFDKRFNVSCDPEKTGVEKGLLISNSTRDLTVQFFSNRLARDWMCEIAKLMSKGEYNNKNRYNSFAPIRENSYIKGYVDGKDYFSDVADAILLAEQEIFITDWWLSPEIMLKRSFESGPAFRLDMLLKKKADQGVKIYVILYKEIEMSLGINSAYSKSALLKLNSENIKVMRHPDHVGSTSILLWAHHEKLVCIDQKKCFLGDGLSYNRTFFYWNGLSYNRNFFYWSLDLCYGRWDDHNHRLTDFGSVRRNLLGSTDKNLMKVAMNMALFNIDDIGGALNKNDAVNSKLFIGKDYTNPYIADVPEVERPFTDYLDRDTQQRMPWHDIACFVVGDAARDVAWHFIQRWNFTKQEKQKENKYYPFLLPKIADENLSVEVEEENEEMCNVQLLRSASIWSCGSQIVDHSILDAYLDQIEKAKHYIYIENQFFITSLKDCSIENGIGYKLVERIVRAHKEQQAFRVYVVMPLLPSFPGEIGDPASTSTCFVEFWNLSSSRNIINLLKENGIEDTTAYICFCGLRTYGNLRHKKVTEIVYVHSKLMIVDDSVVIMGSANINDRSMLGVRDSELAVCVEDTKMVPGTMNGVEILVGSFAKALRMKIFKEHLGLLADDTPNNYRDTICSTASVLQGDNVANATGANCDHLQKTIISAADTEDVFAEDIENHDDVISNQSHDDKGSAMDEVDGVGKSYNSKSECVEHLAEESNDETDDTFSDNNDDTLCNEYEKACLLSATEDDTIDTNIEATTRDANIETDTLTVNYDDSSIETNENTAIADVKLIDTTLDENNNEKATLLGADTERFSSSKDGTVLEIAVDYSCNNYSESKIDVNDNISSKIDVNVNISSQNDGDGLPPDDNTEVIESSDGNVVNKCTESSSQLNDVPCEPTSSFTRNTLRQEIEIDVTDPVCEEFWNVWIQTAKNNTEIYEEVFKCLPTKEVKSFEELATYKATPGLAHTDPIAARSRLKNIHGFLVDKPLDFLCKQNLYPAASTKESLVPTSVFT